MPKGIHSHCSNISIMTRSRACFVDGLQGFRRSKIIQLLKDACVRNTHNSASKDAPHRAVVQNMLIPTLREAPSDIVSKSHALMLRAGMIRPLAPGVLYYQSYLMTEDCVVHASNWSMPFYRGLMIILLVALVDVRCTTSGIQKSSKTHQSDSSRNGVYWWTSTRHAITNFSKSLAAIWSLGSGGLWTQVLF